MDLEIKINRPISVITTFSLDKTSDKIKDENSVLFQNNDETSKLTDEDLMNKDILSPIISNSDTLFLILSVTDKSSTYKAIEIYEMAIKKTFTVVIAQMPPSLDSNEQRILSIKNMSELKRYVDPLLIFSSRSMSQSLNSPESQNKVDVVAPIRTLTEIVQSDLSFNLQTFQDSFHTGTSYYGEGIAHKNSLLFAAKTAVNQLMMHNEQVLAFSRSLLILITTSTELFPKDINIISDYFNPLFTQYVAVTFLAPVVPSIKNQVRVTIISSGL